MVIASDNFAHDDDVVAALAGVYKAALGVSERAIEHGRARFSPTAPAQPSEAVARAGGELLSNLLLVGGQDIHSKAARRPDSFEAARMLVHADK